MADRFYITTPIYYPNGEPHLGHVYTTTCADVLARYHRLMGHDTFFLTGTDEHGIKMVKTAAEEKVDPSQLADRNVAIFQEVWKEFDFSHDYFIRTTSDLHKQSVIEIVRKLLANDDIYLGSYEGWYDEGQEEFVTETEAKNAEYKSLISGRPLVRYKEPTYFFRLSKYSARVLEYIESHPQFIQPVARRNEVISKLKGGVEDLSISRATLKWGIVMPNDADHVLYVWIDALSNYITGLGYGSSDDGKFQRFWPADVHLIGKEILWFHTVYWPAMLMSLGIDQPRCVYAHGWWTADGRKMSKSLGNFIGLERLRESVSKYSLDALRYYMLRAAPFGSDLDWSDADFANKYNELANVVGNCLNRVLKMVNNYRDGSLPPIGAREDIDDSISSAISKFPQQLHDSYARIDLQHCTLLPVELARAANGYIDATAPFSLAKDPSKSARLDTVLHLSTHAIYLALCGLLPVLPNKAAAGLSQLGIDPQRKNLAELLNLSAVSLGRLGSGQPLFPKAQ